MAKERGSLLSRDLLFQTIEAASKFGGALTVPTIVGNTINHAYEKGADALMRTGSAAIEMTEHVAHLFNLQDSLTSLRMSADFFSHPIVHLTQVLAGTVLLADSFVGEHKLPDTVGHAIKKNIAQAVKSAVVIAAPAIIPEIPHLINNLVEGNRIISSCLELGVFTIGGIAVTKAASRVIHTYKESVANHKAHKNKIRTSKQLKLNKITPDNKKVAQFTRRIHDKRVVAANKKLEIIKEAQEELIKTSVARRSQLAAAPEPREVDRLSKPGSHRPNISLNTMGDDLEVPVFIRNRN